MNCVNCGSPFAEGTRFCPSCGAQQPSARPAAPVLEAPSAQPAASPPGQRPLPQLGAPVAPPVSPSSNVSNLAVVSLVTGIASYLGFTVFTAIVAIITGHMARKEIAQSGGQKSGGGMAMAGLILGYAHFALICIGVSIFVLILAGIFGTHAMR